MTMPDAEKTVVYRFVVDGANRAIAEFTKVRQAAKSLDDDEFAALQRNEAARAKAIATQRNLGGVVLGSVQAERQYGAAVDSSARAIANRAAARQRETELTTRVTELERQLAAAAARTADARARTVKQIQAEKAELAAVLDLEAKERAQRETAARDRLRTTEAQEKAAAADLERMGSLGDKAAVSNAQRRLATARAVRAEAAAALAEIRVVRAEESHLRDRANRAAAEARRIEKELRERTFDQDAFRQQLQITAGAWGQGRNARRAQAEIEARIRRTRDEVLRVEQEAATRGEQIQADSLKRILAQQAAFFAERNRRAIKAAEKEATIRASRDDDGPPITLLQRFIESEPTKLRHWQVIWAAILTAVVTLIPALAAATGAMGALLAVTVTAFAGIGAFAIAAAGHLTDVVKKLKEAQETGQPLEGRFIAVGRAWDALRERWQRFQAQTQGPVFEVFIRAIEHVTAMLPRVTPIANAMAKALSGVVDQLDVAAASDTFADFLDMVRVEGPRVVDLLAASFLNIGEGVTELVLAFRPFLLWFLGGLEQLTRGFANWANSLEGSERFAEFMDYARRIGPIVLDTIELIAKAAINLGVGLAPIAEDLLLLVRVLAQFIAGLDPATITTVTYALLGLLVVLKGVRAAVAISRFWGKFLEEFPSVQNHITRATRNMNGLGKSIYSVGVALTGLAAGSLLVVGLSLGLSALAESQAKAAANANAHADAVLRLAQALRESNGQLTEADRLAKYEELAATKIEVPWYKKARSPWENTPVQSVTQVAEMAGINQADLVAGALGDAEKRAQNIAKLRQLIADLWKELYAEGTTRDRRDNILNQIRLVEGAIPAYEALAPTMAEATAENRRYTQAAQGAAGATDQVGAGFRRVAGEIAKALEKNDDQKQLDTAIDAYERYKDALESWEDAKEAVRDVERDSARAVEDALDRMQDAQRSYTDAVYDACDAQNQLNEARRTAAERLQDLRIKVRDLKNEEEGAAISVERAKENYQRVFRDPNASALDRREAALRLSEAYYNQQDQARDAKQTRQEAAEAERLGIEGSPDVQRALRRKRDADQAVIDAERAKKRAAEDYFEAIEDGREAIDDARKAQKKANDEMMDAANNYDIMAAAAGRTADQVARLADERDRADKDLYMDLQAIDKNDAEGRLRRIVAYLAQAKMIAGRDFGSFAQVAAPASGLDQYRIPSSRKEFIGPVYTSPGLNYYRGYSAGGPIRGAGGPEGDDIPAWLSAGEHVLTSREVAAAGGHGLVEKLRDALRTGKIGQAELMAFLATTLTFARGGAVEYAINLDRLDFPGQVMASIAQGYAAGGPVRRRRPTTPMVAGARFDPAMFYAALDAAARDTSIPGQVPRGVPATAVAGVSHTTNAGISMGNVTIHNPVQERSEKTLRRKLQTLAYLDSSR